MLKKILFVISSKYVFSFNNCCPMLEFTKIEGLDNQFLRILTDGDVNGNIKDRIEKNIIETYKEVDKQSSREFQLKLQVNFKADIKPHIITITEGTDLKFSDNKEIPADGIKNITGKTFFVLKSISDDKKSVNVVIYKKIPENKMIDKNGDLKDYIENH